MTTQLFSLDDIMTRNTNGNYIKPMFRGVSLVMVVLLGLSFVAYGTSEAIGFLKSTRFNSALDGAPRFALLWILLFIFSVSVFANFLPLFCFGVNPYTFLNLFAVLIVIVLRTLQNALALIWIFGFTLFRNTLSIFAPIFFFALFATVFTVWEMTIRPVFVAVELVNRFCFPTVRALFIHSSSNENLPVSRASAKQRGISYCIRFSPASPSVTVEGIIP